MANIGTQATSSETGGARIYVVKSGDRLVKLAGQFGTTVNAIRRANGLKTCRIVAGQKLKIPGRIASSTGPAPVPVSKATS
jgi:membrane-bound lytic murein transglycosylase D